MNVGGTDSGALGESRRSVLANRDFVKLLAGQTVSLMGTQVTLFVMPLVAILTLRATVFEVGVLNALRLAPVIITAPLAGVWLDRTRRRPVLVACALGSALLIGLVPLAQTADFLSIGLLYVVVTLVGGLNVVFDVGALSYVPSLVGREHLMEANGKLQSSLAVAGIAGPAIGGLLVALITAPITLSVDAASYLCTAFGLISIRRPEPAPAVPEVLTPFRRQIAEGFRAVYGSKLLRALLTQTAVLNLSYGAYWTIFVVYAIRVLGLNAIKLGFVVGAASVGALFGALLASRARKALGMGRNMTVATIGASTMLLLVLIPHGAGVLTVLILMAAQFLYGINIGNINVNGITLRQIVTPKQVLARMNATYRMLLFGAPPLGSIIGGLLGAAIGLYPALLVALIVMISPVLWLFFSPIFRLSEMPLGPIEETGKTVADNTV